MKKFILAFALVCFAPLASAQLAAGWLQGGGATSTSGVEGIGGTGSIGAGIAYSGGEATSSNLSGSLVTQTPGTTTVITESYSDGGQQSLSGSLGGAGGFSGNAYSADGGAIGGGIQGFGVVLP